MILADFWLALLDDVDDWLFELEERLFGIQKPIDESRLYITDEDFVPLKTGIEDFKIMKYGPKHIIDAE